MGFRQCSIHDLCIFVGTHPDFPTSPIYVGCYVDNFVYYEVVLGVDGGHGFSRLSGSPEKPAELSCGLGTSGSPEKPANYRVVSENNVIF